MLEEPEHLTWFHHGTRWTDKFNHVVGIMHTNYLDYARREEGGETKAKLLEAYNNWVCRVHCHKVRNAALSFTMNHFGRCLVTAVGTATGLSWALPQYGSQQGRSADTSSSSSQPEMSPETGATSEALVERTACNALLLPGCPASVCGRLMRFPNKPRRCGAGRQAERRGAATAAADDAVCARRAALLPGGGREEGRAGQGGRPPLHPRRLLHGQGAPS